MAISGYNLTNLELPTTVGELLDGVAPPDLVCDFSYYWLLLGGTRRAIEEVSEGAGIVRRCYCGFDLKGGGLVGLLQCSDTTIPQDGAAPECEGEFWAECAIQDPDEWDDMRRHWHTMLRDRLDPPGSKPEDLHCALLDLVWEDCAAGDELLITSALTEP